VGFAPQLTALAARGLLGESARCPHQEAPHTRRRPVWGSRHKRVPPKTNPEDGGPCCLDRSLAFDPCLTCSGSFLPCGGSLRAVPAWAPGSLTNRTIRLGPRDSILPFTVSGSPQPAVRYRPLPPLRNSPANVVTQRARRFAAGKPMDMAARPACPCAGSAPAADPLAW
jgi:hypothetical protein